MPCGNGSPWSALNLRAADTVIVYDPWWNLAVERQAMDRAHRIGQCCIADYLVIVWSVYFDGLERGFLTLFQFCWTVPVTAAGLRMRGVGARRTDEALADAEVCAATAAPGAVPVAGSGDAQALQGTGTGNRRRRGDRRWSDRRRTGVSVGAIDFGEEGQLFAVVEGWRGLTPALVIAPDPAVVAGSDGVAEGVEDVDDLSGGFVADLVGHVDVDGHGRSSSRAFWRWPAFTVRAFSSAAAESA